MDTDTENGETCSKYCNDIDTDVYRVIPNLEEDIFNDPNFDSQVQILFNISYSPGK